MKTYILSIPKRLKQKIDLLDAKAVLCNRSWEVFNDEGVKQVFIFKEDESIIVSTNGEVEKGTWTLYPQNHSIVISLANTSKMFHPAFVDEIIFALQQDGKQDTLFLIDSKEIALFPNRTLAELNAYFVKSEQKLIEEEKRSREEDEKLKKKKKEQEKAWLKREALRKQVMSQCESEQVVASLVQILGGVMVFVSCFFILYSCLGDIHGWGLKLLVVCLAVFLHLLLLVLVLYGEYAVFDSFIDKMIARQQKSKQEDAQLSKKPNKEFIIKSLLAIPTALGLAVAFFFSIRLLPDHILGFVGVFIGIFIGFSGLYCFFDQSS